MATNISKQLTEQKNSKANKRDLRRIFVKVGLAIAITVSAIVAVVTTVAVIGHTSNLRTTRAEYAYLQEIAEIIQAESAHIQLSTLDEAMLAINPDYVAWIRIDGTNIDYPVVRGPNNEKYLDRSFYGEENIAGAIFMDFRNIGNLATQRVETLRNIIIYGHNLRQGGMFTELHRLLDDNFLEQNNIITLIVNDNIVHFEIFSVRLTDVNDPAYFLSFNTPQDFPRFADRIGAPLRATQIITLSTCIVGGNDDDRLIVQGYRLFDAD